MIKRSYSHILLSGLYLIFIVHYASIQSSLFFQGWLIAILFFFVFKWLREIIQPIAKIENRKLLVFFSVFKKPIVLPIEKINKIKVHKRGYFPVCFEFILDMPSNNIISLDRHMLSSENEAFHELIKQSVKQCEFEELEYIEPENNSLFSRIFNKQFSYRSIITFSSIMLLIVIIILQITISSMGLE